MKTLKFLATMIFIAPLALIAVGISFAIAPSKTRRDLAVCVTNAKAKCAANRAK